MAFLRQRCVGRLLITGSCAPKPIRCSAPLIAQHPPRPAFLTFLRHAAAARQNGSQAEAAASLAAMPPRNSTHSTTRQIAIASLLRCSSNTVTTTRIAARRHYCPTRSASRSRALPSRLRAADGKPAWRTQSRPIVARSPSIRTLPQLRNNLAGALTTHGWRPERAARLCWKVRFTDRTRPTATRGLISLTASRANLNLLSRAAKPAQARGAMRAAIARWRITTMRWRCDEAQRWAGGRSTPKERACALAPDDAAMRSNLGMLLLMRGNYARGWASSRGALGRLA